jgi:two-component system invasion response regulator UvrY
MGKTTIFIVDDHKLIRETWCFFLNRSPLYEVVAECGSGEEAIESIKKFRPDIVLMDINLPGMNGIEATQLIRKFSPGSKILGVSLHTQPSYVRQLIKNGAMGYLTKNSSAEEMFHALNEILSGRKYICSEVKNIISEQEFYGPGQPKGINGLSKRELEVITWLKKGLSSKEIADRIFVSSKTVEVHRYNILKKLNLKNTAALINFINRYRLELE